MTAGIYRLDNPVQNYAWGSTTTIPRLLGVEPTGEPVAELWLGAHPAAPSQVIGPQGPRSLAQLIGDDPQEMLGAGVVERFGELPFLLKILAVARPLSLQAHPSLAQAQAGFAAENAARVPIDSPLRNYRDANHKPEQVCALTEFDGLCGFRPVAETVDFLAALAGPPPDTPLLDALRERLAADGGLRDVVTDLLSRSPAGVTRLLAELVPAAERVARAGGNWAAEAGWIVRLDAEYPGDRGAAVATLLNLVHLEPGQALSLRAGELHAYLHGTAVELLANSDNVLRGGLTPKHIDVPELVRVLQIREVVVAPLSGQRGPTGECAYPSEVADFRLARLDLADVASSVSLPAGLPRILLCTSGTAVVVPPSGEPMVMSAGDGVFVAANSAASVGGAAGRPATVYVARPNLD